MSYFAPKYDLRLYKRNPSGAGLGKGYSIRSLFQANCSLVTAGGVGQAQIQVWDPGGQLLEKLAPQPMDVLSFSTNSRWDPSLKVIWTGFIDTVLTHVDPNQGRLLVFTASSVYKLWEITSLGLGTTFAQGVNDPLALAIASINSIAAQELIKITAAAVNYPGALAGLPANPQIHFGPTTAYGGLWSMSIPDGVAEEPDLATYSAIVQGMVADTGNELFSDEVGNIIFRPIGYLNTTKTPTGVDMTPRRILAEDILSIDLGRSDQGVLSEVRVRNAYNYAYSMDAVWTAPQGLAKQLGTRVRVVPAPWIRNSDAATFLARALGQMAAANVGIGSVSIPADPAFQLGTVCAVQALDNSGGWGYYYVAGIVFSGVWGETWDYTLQLGFGRSPTESFPYIGSQSIPVLSGGGLDGVPTGNGNISFIGGKLQATLTNSYDGTLTNNVITVPPGLVPAGSIVLLDDAHGEPFGPSPNGDYTVQDGASNQTTIGINAKGATGVPITGQPLTFTIVQYGEAPSTATSTPTSTSTGSGTSTVPSTMQSPTSGDSTTTGTADANVTPSGFSFWPVPGTNANNITQPFGPTKLTAEFPYTYVGPPDPPRLLDQYYTLFHTGIDIALPGAATDGLPIKAPCDGVVIFAGSDLTGYGNLTIIQAGQLRLYFGHQSVIQVQVQHMVVAGSVIGKVGHTGNIVPNDATGSHLHFGVLDGRLNGALLDGTPGGFVDPMDFF